MFTISHLIMSQSTISYLHVSHKLTHFTLRYQPPAHNFAHVISQIPLFSTSIYIIAHCIIAFPIFGTFQIRSNAVICIYPIIIFLLLISHHYHVFEVFFGKGIFLNSMTDSSCLSPCELCH